MRHTITVLVENEFGVLTRVAGLFSARGYNIESLNVAPTLDETVSRMTLVTRGDERIIEQIKKQLNKLIPVIKTEDISHKVHLEREMLLVKIQADPAIAHLVYEFDGKIIDEDSGQYMIVEITGHIDALQDFLNKASPFGVIESTRTGPVGMSRGVEGFVVE
ncbi:MAG: acetolactate synthase small subunit [Mariprofundaceae bacterium]|nr:acetolactate synthase small subunit [Mariprofundaceae bacterium]